METEQRSARRSEPAPRGTDYCFEHVPPGTAAVAAAPANWEQHSAVHMSAHVSVHMSVYVSIHAVVGGQQGEVQARSEQPTALPARNSFSLTLGHNLWAITHRP